MVVRSFVMNREREGVGEVSDGVVMESGEESLLERVSSHYTVQYKRGAGHLA
jgi:hypothetical protein